MLYHIRLEGEAQGPWPLRDIVMMSGVTPETLVCPEFELGAWRPLEAVIGTRGDTAFLFQIRLRAEMLLRSNQKLRWELSQRAADQEKNLEQEKGRAAAAEFELERRKRQLDEVLDHNLELDSITDENREKLEAAQRGLAQAQKDFDRVDAEGKAMKHRAQTLERELEEMRRLSSDTEATRTQLQTLRAELESSERELTRARAVKEARDRQFDALRAQLDEAGRKSIELEARLRTQSFETETVYAERAKELELYKLRAQKAETGLEEKRQNAEELRLRLDAVEARAAEAESRLRSAASSSTATEESLRAERDALASEAEKGTVLAAERAKTIEDLRNQMEALRDRAAEAENRLRVAQTKYAGADANLREEKETLSRQVEIEKGRRRRAEDELAAAQEELNSLRAREDALGEQNKRESEAREDEAAALKQELLRKAQTIERLETRLERALRETAAPVLAGPPEEQDPEKTPALSPASADEPEVTQQTEAAVPPAPAPTPSPQEESVLSPNAPTVEVGPPAEQPQELSKRKFPWKLFVAAALAAAAGVIFWYITATEIPPAPTAAPVQEAVMELPPAEEESFDEAPQAQQQPTLLKPQPQKNRAPRKRIKRVEKKTPEAVALPGYGGD